MSLVIKVSENDPHRVLKGSSVLSFKPNIPLGND